MAHLDNQHCLLIIANGINNPIGALPEAVLFIARQLIAPVRPGILGKRLNSAGDPSAILLGEGFKFPGSGRLDEDPIACYASSSP